MKTQDNSIDFEVVSPEQVAEAVQVSPAEHAKNLETKFGLM